MSFTSSFLAFSMFSAVLVFATEYNKYGGHHHSYYQPMKVNTYGSGYHSSESYGNKYDKDYHSDKPEQHYYEPKYEDYGHHEKEHTPYYGGSYHNDYYAKPEYYGGEYHGHDDHYYGQHH